MNTYCFKLAFIHDEGFNLFRPKSHAELWMAVVFDNFIDFSSQINVTHIEISSDDVAFDTPLTSVGVDREFEGFVLATISCGIGDVIESIVSPSMAPILRLLAREIKECAQTNEYEWNQSRHPVNYFYPSKDVDFLVGKKLRLTLLEEPPFVIFDRHPNGSVIGYKGYCYEIVRLLQTMYNLTYEFILPSDHAFGREMPDGSWNGMIGMVVEQAVDIGLGPFSVTHSRSKVVDFSVGFYEDGNAILIPPAAEENRLLACTKPFRRETWLTLILFAIILPIILWKYSNLFAIRYQERRSTLTKQYLFILGVLIGQSGQKLPSVGFSPRFLGAVWCLSSVVFASAYVGILMSFLRFPKLLPIVSQLEELPESHLKWVVQRGTALDTLFLEATTGVYKTIGEGLLNQQRGSLIDVNEDGVHHVTNGSYAYIAGKSNLESLIYDDYTRSGICRLSIAQQEFFKINVAFAFQKNSPLKPFIDKKILQMVESGLGIYWKKLYWPPSDGKCGKVKQSDTGPKSLSLIDLQGAFIILAIGFYLGKYQSSFSIYSDNKMFQKFFLFACLLAVMAVVYTNSAPTENEQTADEEEKFLLFCRWFTSCTNSTQCAGNLIYRTCNGGRCCKG
ncbi:Uncharacterized protein APZ42_021438 [Daphnia magna]|uniref:Ionotropic glutamate receptor L-glutamate and glycine-binding domain-containing protein n=1 Tax=Daphnia magna TaxID=35525 RepID=A0A164WPP7_9CRUS|nr:Uncharacterized protein APZ42_021438 [Daphnia magna]